MRALAPIFILLLFIASCNPCKNSNCQNSGTCVEGTCNCVTPFGGKNCETNLCDSTICNNGGTCISGLCACAAGYEGPRCDSLVTTKFTGNFSSVSSCPTASGNVSVTASGIPSACNIYFTSLDGFQPYAIVSGYGITIQSQYLNNGQTATGSGQLSLDRQTITLTMTITPAGLTTGSTCTYTLTRM